LADAILKLSDTQLQRPDLRRSFPEFGRLESTAGPVREQSLHGCTESGLMCNCDGSAPWIAPATERRIKHLEGHHFGCVTVVAVGEIRMLPPVHMADEINVETNSRRSGDHAAIAPNEVLDQSTLQVSGNPYIRNPSAG
jgi:hypothetical protein